MRFYGFGAARAGYDIEKLREADYDIEKLREAEEESDVEWEENAKGLSSAEGYGVQHDPEVAKKATAIKDKLGLDSDKGEYRDWETDRKSVV